MSIKKNRIFNPQSVKIWPSFIFSRGIYFLFFFFLLSACSTKPESKNNTSSVKFDQYYLQGEQLYQLHCSNCHQKNGTGLGLVYPPLNESDFIDNHTDDVICLIKFGKEGELLVNGKKFNKKMPALPTLSNLEVAEVATYIFNTWSHKKGFIDVRIVDKTILRCPQ